MNYRMICRVLSTILLCLAGLLLLPLIAGLCYGENVLNFAISIAVASSLGALLRLLRPRDSRLFARDGFAIVGLGWILMALIGALPFVISGSIPNYFDAVFETVSGLTTTGASVLNDIEAMPRGDMFWRQFTHWIGGMGVLVFIMAVLPNGNEHSMHIMRAEVPGPTVGKLVPRARQTATILYLIYIALTLAETVFLLCGGMNFYDALLHAFATAGTGGFSTKAASIAAFDSLYIELVTATFMILFGVNFNLYFLLLIKRGKDVVKNEELHWYLGIVAAAVLAIALGISKLYGGFDLALRHSYFYVASIISTTGFCTVDYTVWPEYCKWILVLLMFTGACAGSTGGGLKISRIAILSKTAQVEIKQTAHPQSVSLVQMDGRRVSDGTIKAVSVYFAQYIFFLLLFTFIVSLDGYDIATNFTAALSCLSNIGPGMSLIGPTGNFDIFSHGVKVALSLAMLIGRLEIYPILVLFSRHAWRA